MYYLFRHRIFGKVVAVEASSIEIAKTIFEKYADIFYFFPDTETSVDTDGYLWDQIPREFRLKEDIPFGVERLKLLS